MFVLALLAALGSLMLVACETGESGTVASSGPEVYRRVASPEEQRAWADTDGGGLADTRWFESVGNAPDFDLQRCLQAGEGGGGAQSPFREDAAEDGLVRYPADWPRISYRRGDPTPPPPHIRPRFDEELWIIQKFSSTTPPTNTDDRPGSGSLMCRVAPDQILAVPLKHTEVDATIEGTISKVRVRQEFLNPYSSKIEAMYVFPLPEDAAVNGFVMKVGSRTIRGIIREREEAQRIYNDARAQGYVASLLTQERPNIFTQAVANIEPGKRIDVEITYFNTLPYRDGAFEFVFPMVVGPRFNPPGSADPIVASSVGRPQINPAGPGTEVQYLRPNQRSGHDIAVTVEIDAGMDIDSITSSTHAIDISNRSRQGAKVTLGRLDTIPNKDFVLRYEVAADEVTSGLITYRDHSGGYFSLMLVPPKDLERIERAPMEMVFVLDCSGSMNGYPIQKAKEAIGRTLRQLRPRDTFQVISFSNDASVMGPRPVIASPENVRRGLEYVESLNSEGGTMMMTGIRSALDYPHDPDRTRFICFLTDGYIGNEAEILGAIRERIGESHIFSFGVGSSVNRYLLESMARIGRGAVAYVSPQDDAGAIMDDFFGRISRAALTNISIDWGDGEVADVYPRILPDLYIGRPVVITGRFRGDLRSVKVTGRTSDDRGRGRKVSLPVSSRWREGNDSALPAVWARMQLAAIAEHIPDPQGWDRDRVKSHSLELALKHGLMSAYTSFVAVDSMTRTSGEYGTTVTVPVEMPEGVRYDTTVR